MRHAITGLAAACLPLLISSLFSGCPSSSGGGGATEGIVEVEAQGTGEISGRIVLINRYQQRLGDKSGVLVSVEGFTSRSVTNSEGEWSLTGIPAGLITIVWEKPDFGLYKQVDIPFDGVRLANVKGWVVERPKYEIELFSDSISGKQLFFTGVIKGEFSLPSSAIRVFFGMSPDVSFDPGKYLVSMKDFVYVNTPVVGTEAPTLGVNMMSAKFSISMDPVIVQRNEFRPGSIVYAVAYPDASPSLSYLDPKTGREVYMTLNPRPSSVVRIVMP